MTASCMNCLHRELAAECRSRAPTGRKWRQLVLVVSLGLLVACGKSDERALLSSAGQRLERGDLPGALIDVRNLLMDNAESGPGRLMHSRVLLAGGDLENAESELKRAQALGQPALATDLVTAALLRAQGRPELVLERYKATELADKKAHAALRTLVALAYSDLGDLELAKLALGNALAADPNHLDALILKARTAAREGDNATALRMAAQLLEREPSSGQLWLLQGDLLAQDSKDKPAAAQSYRKALQLRPRQMEAHGKLISLLLDLGDLPGATAHAAELSKVMPNSPIADFYVALTAYMGGDFARVRERAQRLLRAESTDPRVSFLAGMAELRLGALASAETLLVKAVSAMPDAVEPRRELAGLHLRLVRPAAALDTLRPMLDADTKDSGAWRVAGQAHALGGDFRMADSAFAKAAKLQPGDTRVRMAMGQSLISRGQADSGLSEIRAAAEADAAGVDADMELISALMRRRDAGEALKATDRLARKRPDSPMPDYLRGRILEQSGNLSGARAAYEKALARDAGFAPAVNRMVRFDLRENRIDAARTRYQNLLKKHPLAAEAMMALAGITMRGGGSREDGAMWVDKAVQAAPSDAATWRSAIIFHRDMGDISGALARARAAMVAVPGNIELLALITDIQIAAHDLQQAVATAQSMVQLQPASVYAQIKLAQAYLASGHTANARQYAAKALSLKPDSPAAVRAAVAVEVRDKKASAALIIARRLQARHASEALGWQIEGEIAAAEADWPAAATAFRTAMSKSQSTLLATQLHAALARGGKEGEAEQIERKWLAAHRGDTAFQIYLAEQASARGDWAASETRYRQVLQGQPDNATLLNNLAVVLVRKKDPASLAVAQRAVEQAPFVAAIADTLAMAYAQLGDVSSAIGSQSRAVGLAPQVSEFRLRLAEYLLRAGNKKGARLELERLDRQSSLATAQSEEVQRLKRQAQD